METLNISDGDLTHRQEIIQLLRMAIEQQWSMSYVTAVKNRVTTHSLYLVSVNALEGTVSVSGKNLDTIKPGQTIMFRGQSGSLSVVFQTRKDDSATGVKIQNSDSIFEFDIPYKIACTQLRKTLRVNVDSFYEVPVILYMVNGALTDSVLMDISTSGAKFSVHKDLNKELNSMQMVDACKIALPGGEVIQTGVQLIQMINDEQSELSFLRCQFIHMKPEEENKLEKFIEDTLAKVNDLQTD
jgi:hypothetical protein